LLVDALEYVGEGDGCLRCVTGGFERHPRLRRFVVSQ
jgi:hypothetical protein